MARHLHVVHADPRPRPRRDVEAGVTRSVELVAAATAGLAGTIFAVALPRLSPRDRSGRRGRTDIA